MFTVGVVIGVVVGRWWALLAPIAFGLYVTAEADVEVPSWFLGCAYAGMGAFGVTTGIVMRRGGRSSRRERHEDARDSVDPEGRD